MKSRMEESKIGVNSDWLKGITFAVEEGLKGAPDLFVDFLPYPIGFVSIGFVLPEEYEFASGASLFGSAISLAIGTLKHCRHTLDTLFCSRDDNSRVANIFAESMAEIDLDLLDKLAIQQRRAIELLLPLIATSLAASHQEYLFHVHYALSKLQNRARLEIDDDLKFSNVRNTALASEQKFLNKRIVDIDNAINKINVLWKSGTKLTDVKTFQREILRYKLAYDIEQIAFGLTYQELYGRTSEQIHASHSADISKRDYRFEVQRGLEQSVLLSLCLLFRIQESQNRVRKLKSQVLTSLSTKMHSVLPTILAAAVWGYLELEDYAIVDRKGKTIFGKVLNIGHSNLYLSYEIADCKTLLSDWYPAHQVALLIPRSKVAVFMAEAVEIVQNVTTIEEALPLLEQNLFGRHLIRRYLQDNDSSNAYFIDLGRQL